MEDKGGTSEPGRLLQHRILMRSSRKMTVLKVVFRDSQHLGTDVVYVSGVKLAHS